jgi:L-serine dehydratase
MKKAENSGRNKSRSLYIWQQIKECIYKGVNKEGILPGGLNVSRRAAGSQQKALGDKIYKNKDEWFQQVVDAEENFTNINKWIACFTGSE